MAIDKVIAYARDTSGVKTPIVLEVPKAFGDAVQEAKEKDAAVMLTIYALFDEPERLRDALLYASGEGVTVLFFPHDEDSG